jgi:UDP-GlcNAc:undecaprenyl-phosphate GlcNAc-1-phosphate transferase
MAAGVSAIGASFFLVLALRSGETQTALVAAALAGAALAFLKFNFHRASVFMGDTGSLFLGFVLGSLGVMSTFKNSNPLHLFIPVVILGIPIFDTSLAVARRIWKRKPIFSADCEHFYEWLWKKRMFGYRAIVIMTYLGCLMLGLAALLMGRI